MGLFDRFRSTAAPPPGRFYAVPPEGFMRVVGESQYQPTLSQLSRRCTPGPDGRPSFPVALIREPHNAYDEHAVAVVSDAGHVGYLPREDARRYGASFRVVMSQGYDGLSCLGLLNGGDHRPPNYGVTLCMPYPEECELHFGLRHPDGKPTSGRVRGRHYTDYTEEVKSLRRAGDDLTAETLLRELVDATEQEARALSTGVAPWHYEQLAIIARKRKDAAAEVEILERFARAPHAPGAGPARLLERLEKARALRG